MFLHLKALKLNILGRDLQGIASVDGASRGARCEVMAGAVHCAEERRKMPRRC